MTKHYGQDNKGFTKAIEKLQKAFPGIENIKDGEPWGAGKNSIHLGDAAEGGTIDGLPAADSYAWEYDPAERTYILGIHRKLAGVLDDIGYFAEWYDAGTVIAYPM